MGFEMNNTIQVLDALMGSGKTTALLNWILQNSQNRYLYVTPLLSEIDRVLKHCESIQMKTPEISTGKTKSRDFLEKLRQGENICITHMMYQDMHKDHLKAIEDFGYTLIIDEEVGFVSALEGYSFDDVRSLFDKNLISVDYANFGKVKFEWDIGDFHKFSRLKNLCDIGAVYACKNQKEVFVTQLPLDLVTKAQRVIVSTYGYYGSVMHKFMQMKGIEHKDFSEVTLMYSEKEIKENIANLIEFVQTPSTNKVKKFSMSYSWWNTSGVEAQAHKKKVFSAIRSVKRLCNAKDEDFMYCTQKTSSENTSLRTYSLKHEESFVYASCRATNNYRNKTVLVHAYNRYANVQVQKYMVSYGFKFNDDHIALYELLQWIWRSAIREHKQIKLCIIPERMLSIFQIWLLEVSPK